MRLTASLEQEKSAKSNRDRTPALGLRCSVVPMNATRSSNLPPQAKSPLDETSASLRGPRFKLGVSLATASLARFGGLFDTGDFQGPIPSRADTAPFVPP
jgi:hypothetical protein